MNDLLNLSRASVDAIRAERAAIEARYRSRAREAAFAAREAEAAGDYTEAEARLQDAIYYREEAERLAAS